VFFKLETGLGLQSLELFPLPSSKFELAEFFFIKKEGQRLAQDTASASKYAEEINCKVLSMVLTLPFV
jgi:hypothetical protein